MTNEQSIIEVEGKMQELKDSYMRYLGPLVAHGVELSLEQVLECQRLGNLYFNFVENFVGTSGLLGAHANGKWVTGFAETCHAVLETVLIHFNFIESYIGEKKELKCIPSANAYANMQRMVKEYLEKDNWSKIKRRFEENGLPVSGFKYAGVGDLKENPKEILYVCLAVGIFFAIAVLILAVVIPNPTPTQFLIFRGVFAISLAAISAIIPGLLNVQARYRNNLIKASGAIAVFVIIWMINPPGIISR